MKTQRKTKIYDFKSQEFIGKNGENILDKWLGSIYKILDVSTVKKYQNSGIDRILMRPDGSTVSVEYKFDLASSRTGNLFFETVSVDNKNIPGWGWLSQAEYWIFLLPTMEVLVVEPGKMRNMIWCHRWELQEFYTTQANPYQQAEHQLFALLDYCNLEPILHQKVPGR
ncbi:MAG: hypothetical protein ACKPE2_12850, partial [Dolichospermum sp.]